MNDFYKNSITGTMNKTYQVDFAKEEFMVRSKWHLHNKKYENAINISYKIGEKVSIIQFFWKKFLFSANICRHEKLYSFMKQYRIALDSTGIKKCHFEGFNKHFSTKIILLNFV